MERIALVERAKMYLQLLSNGVHPVTGQSIPQDSAFVDPKVKRCFSFISEVLDEYVELKAKADQLEKDRNKNTIVVAKKQVFSITQEQCNSIKLSKEPISVMAFMKNINEVIDVETTEKLSSTRINKWLTNRGLVTSEKVQTVTNKTIYKPSDVAVRLGITEESFDDRKRAEVKTQIKLEERAQLFIIDNLEEIIATT